MAVFGQRPPRRVEAIQAAGLYAPSGERLNHHPKPNKQAAFFLGTETAPKEQPERVKPQGGGGRVEAIPYTPPNMDNVDNMDNTRKKRPDV